MTEELEPVVLRLVFYRDSQGDERWRLEHPANGNVLADGGQGYTAFADAVRGAALSLNFTHEAWVAARAHAEDALRFVLPAVSRDLLVVVQR